MTVEPEADSALDPARAALDRGDYGRCLSLLQPLAERHPATTPMGGSVRLLMATAQMGQGDNAAAAASCRSLRACRDTSLRAMARDLQEVLEAPALQRPREWSMTLPSLGEMEPLEGEFKAMARSRRRRRQPDAPPPPPTGPTRAPLGFALLALALLAITVLLGGCMQLETTVRLPGPGRVQFSHTSLSSTAEALPWQNRWAEALAGGPLLSSRDHGRLMLSSPILPAPQALELLRASITSGSRLAGLNLPDPRLDLRERNWLLGVSQRLHLELDLRQLESLPGLELALRVEPLPGRAVRLAEPEQALPLAHRGSDEPPAVRWPLRSGALNVLEISCWRWSPLGLGAALIALLLILVSWLQRLRLAAGFGPPQLPS